MSKLKLEREQFFSYVTKSLVNSKVALQYLNSRKISAKQVTDFKIGFVNTYLTFCDTVDLFPDQLLFPMLDEYNYHLGFISRTIKPVTDKNKRYSKFLLDPSKKGFLYGIHNAIESIYKSKTVLLVEGVFDVLAVQPHFPAVVGLLKSGLTSAQANVLVRYADKILYAPDNDEAGIKSTEDLLKYYGRKFSISKIDIPAKDPSQWKKDDKEGFVDYFDSLRNTFF